MTLPDSDTESAENQPAGLDTRDVLNQLADEPVSVIPDTGPWQPPTVEELQRLLPQYEVTALLGRGGMGAVYRGTQTNMDRPVAIKILSNELEAIDAGFSERFKNEARALAKLKHRGIVDVYEFGSSDDGLLYIAMEFIDGTDVAHMLAKQRRLPTDHAIAITAHVCDALAYAHLRGIIHRDIKPANIMVGYDGAVKVTDFGLVKMNQDSRSGLTQSGVIMGTLQYMAPEALMLGSSVDQRADIYAVGVLFYQMLTGKLPQGVFKLPSLLVPGLDVRYDDMIGKALREDREMRYQSVLEMRHAMDAILTHPVVEAVAAVWSASAAVAAPKHTEGQPYRPPGRAVVYSRKRRSWVPIMLFGSILAVVLLGGILTFAWLFWSSRVSSNDPSLLSERTQISDTTITASVPPKTTVDIIAIETPSSLYNTSKPAVKYTNGLGMRFVSVPGTNVLFCVHETRKKDYAVYASAESGVDSRWQKAKLEGLEVSKSDDHPVVNVSWNDVTAFCDWLSKREGRRYRLPTDAEWSVAVGLPQQKYPWGFWPPTQRAGNLADITTERWTLNNRVIPNFTDGYTTTSPVMSFDPNLNGLYDMAGNVREYCSDIMGWGKSLRVQRGSGFLDENMSILSSSSKHGMPPDRRDCQEGFRCVIDPASAASNTLAGASPNLSAVLAPPTVEKEKPNNPLPTRPLMTAVATPPPTGALSRRQLVTPELAAIPFPATADDAALGDYVLALLAYFPWEKNQIDKTGEQERLALLRDVAARNFDIVLWAVDHSGSKRDVTSKDAISDVARQYASERNKSAILQAFEKNDCLAVVITEKNWIQESAPFMAAAVRNYAYLEQHSRHAHDFFAACFQSEDSTVWEELEKLFSKTEFSVAHSVFSQGVERMTRPARIRADSRLGRLVFLMWNATSNAPPSSYQNYRILFCAEAAVKFGHVDALKVLAVFLTTGKPEVRTESVSFTQQRIATTLQTLTASPATLTPAETGRWVMDRLASLHWEPARGQFLP